MATRGISEERETVDILMLAGPTAGQRALVEALKDIGATHVVRDVEQAVEALRKRSFDLVIADTDDFARLTAAAGQDRVELVLDHIGHGVCLVGSDGRLTRANSKLLSYPKSAVSAVCKECVKLRAQFTQSKDAAAGPPPARRVRVEVGGGEYSFDVTVAPVSDTHDPSADLVAVVVDVTASRRLQDKLNAIDGAGAELVRIDGDLSAKMDVGERIELLEDKIIRYTRDLMHFDHFCVRVLDPASNRLDTVLAGGMSIEANALPIYANSEGNGISGYTASSGRSYICPDISKDTRYLPGLGNARSSLTVPLRLHDQIVGILNVESERLAAFTEDDRQFAEIFGRYIAIALHILKLLAVERSTTTGQITADVSAEIAAPLNDIVSDATMLIEDYIGHDDLRHRLNEIVDNVDRVKRTIKSMTEQSGVSGLRPETTPEDAVIAGKNILVADDEDIIRDTIADLLTNCGANTLTARDGAEAISLINSRSFDLVLSDIRMPKKDGYEVFSTVKNLNPDCPVILITGFGYDPNHSIVRASQEGLAAVLFKPFKVEQLLEDVRHALTANIL